MKLLFIYNLNLDESVIIAEPNASSISALFRTGISSIIYLYTTTIYKYEGRDGSAIFDCQKSNGELGRDEHVCSYNNAPNL